MATKAFVNRKGELEQLDGLIDEVRKGTTRFVFISGESGVGKAFLVEKFLEDKGNKFTHFATSDQKNRPYSPYLALIEHLDKNSDDSDAKILITELRELFSKKTKSIGRIKEEQEMIFDKFIKLLDTLSKDKLIIIFFDNLHICDDGSIQLTKHLALNLDSSKLIEQIRLRTIL